MTYLFIYYLCTNDNTTNLQHDENLQHSDGQYHKRAGAYCIVEHGVQKRHICRGQRKLSQRLQANQKINSRAMKNHNNLQETQVPMASYARVLTGTDKPTEEPNPYECQIGGFDADGRVSFSEPYTFTQCGTTYNYQTVIVDGGKEVATLEEIQPWPIFEEMRVRYIVPLSEDEAKKNYANTRTSASATTKTQNLGLKLCKTLSTTL